jgi:two-component system, OmpR family, copper resistance phosphate regulon response regulator CusR
MEDERKTAGFLAKGVGETKFRAQIARDGIAGLAAARTGEFDLLIVNIMLPKMDGWTLVKELREAGVNTPASNSSPIGLYI